MYSGHPSKTAANRRSFAGRRFWCGKSPFVCRATFARLRSDVYTAANRLLFAEQRFWCNKSAFVSGMTSTRLRNDVYAAANRRLLIAMCRIGTLDGRQGGFARRFGDRVASYMDGRGFTYCPSDRAFYAWLRRLNAHLRGAGSRMILWAVWRQPFCAGAAELGVR